MIAYVLLNTTANDEHLVYNALLRAKEIDEVWPLFSNWDLIVKIVAEDTNSLEQIINKKIKSLKGVLTTKTLIGY